MPDAPLETTRLLIRIGEGDAAAVAELLPRVYDALHVIASAHLRRERPNHTLQPTALVNELYMKLAAGAPPDLKSRSHFLAVAATAMRHILVNHAKARLAEKRGGGHSRIALLDDPVDTQSCDYDVLSLDEALTKLKQMDARKSLIVEQRFFAGMTVEEIAEAQGVSAFTIERDWRFARAWLSTQLTGE